MEQWNHFLRFGVFLFLFHVARGAKYHTLGLHPTLSLVLKAHSDNPHRFIVTVVLSIIIVVDRVLS